MVEPVITQCGRCSRKFDSNGYKTCHPCREGSRARSERRYYLKAENVWKKPRIITRPWPKRLAHEADSLPARI